MIKKIIHYVHEIVSLSSWESEAVAFVLKFLINFFLNNYKILNEWKKYYKKGFVLVSVFTVVEGPCPAYTITSSGSVNIFVLILLIKLS